MYPDLDRSLSVPGRVLDVLESVGWCTSLDSGYVLCYLFKAPFEIRVRNPGGSSYFSRAGHNTDCI